MLRVGFGISLLVVLTISATASAPARAQGQALAPIKVDLPPTPNFEAAATAPLQYPTGEVSVYGLRKQMNKHLDKDVRVKGYLLEIYECPAEIRKCNDDLAAKAKKDAKKAGHKTPKPGAPPALAEAPKGGCRPCDQPHFFLGDTATTKVERGLLIADYPVKDWETSKPKPLVAKTGEQYVVTGTFAINSITGFAASNGLIIHKKFEDGQGKVLAIGNAVLPPEAQTVQLEGHAVEPLLPPSVMGKKR